MNNNNFLMHSSAAAHHSSNSNHPRDAAFFGAFDQFQHHHLSIAQPPQYLQAAYSSQLTSPYAVAPNNADLADLPSPQPSSSQNYQQMAHSARDQSSYGTADIRNSGSL